MNRIASKDLPKSMKGISRKRYCSVILLRPWEKVSTFGRHWDGGTKRDFHYRDLKTGISRPVQWANAWDSFVDDQLAVEYGQVLVETGYFCGKAVSPTFHINYFDALEFASILDCPIEVTGPDGLAVAHDWLLDAQRDKDSFRIKEWFPWM